MDIKSIELAESMLIMRFNQAIFPLLTVLLLLGCSSVPRLSNLEDWSLDDSSKPARVYRQSWVSPYLGEGADREVNPEHVLRATDILELSCISDVKSMRIGVSGLYVSKTSGLGYENFDFREAKAIRLPMSVVADFQELRITCGDSTPLDFPLCKLGSNKACSTYIQVSTWDQLSERLRHPMVYAKLFPQPDPVLDRYDRVAITREQGVDSMMGAIGPISMATSVKVSNNGLLSVLSPNLTTTKNSPASNSDQLYWRNGVAASLFTVPVAQSGSCKADRVRLSTIQACLNWASSKDISIPENEQTPSMQFRVRECEKYGIDGNFHSKFEDLLNSWKLALQDSTVTLFVENGMSIEVPLTDGAALIPTVTEAYRLATGRELIENWTLLRSTAYLTVQPKAGTCQQHSAPFFIDVGEFQSQVYRPIRLLRGDTIRVSRFPPERISQ